MSRRKGFRGSSGAFGTETSRGDGMRDTGGSAERKS